MEQIKTYILKCSSGEYYCGKSIDISKRLKDHRQGKGWFKRYSRMRFDLLLTILGDYEKNIKRFGVRKFVEIFIYHKFTDLVEVLKKRVSRP